MLLSDVVATSDRVARASARRDKIAAIAALLARAGDDLGIAATYLAGELVQRQIGVGWASLRDLPAPAVTPSLTLAEVDAAFAAIGVLAGSGSQRARREALAGVLARATPDEQAFLARLLSGELRQGAQEAVVLDAVAAACGVPAGRVRRAMMLCGDIAQVAVTARAAGVAGLDAIGLRVGRPVQPMLAGTAPDVDQAMAQVGDAALEWKLDGIRVQVHRDGDQVAVFTRTLDDITARLPEVVALTRALPAGRVVFDGEVIALRPDGRPERFQVTAGRVGRRAGAEVPLTTFAFDLLHLDGQDLLDVPGAERTAALAQIAPRELLVPRLDAPDPVAARAFTADALARGHEGVMVKSLRAPYAAGRRGGAWLKVKPVHVLDLVVIAAEWGHGRRRGRLSNLHLGARDPESGLPVMLGKTFKGLTDEMLAWQTEYLLARATARDEWIVHVRPELVVEIAFDGVQSSSRYPAGMALRFARVRRHRPDKRAGEADTVAAVRAIYEGAADPG